MSTPASTVPRILHISSVLWICAVLAGVAESVLGVISAVRADVPLSVLALNILIRLAVYAFAIWTALRLSAGKHWPRPVLTIELGVIGLGTLVIGPIGTLLDGTAGSLSEFLTSATILQLGFVLIRTTHVIFVLAGVITMFTPRAHSFYRDRAVAMTPGKPPMIRI